MKIIKLTRDTDGKTLYVNVSHIIFYWRRYASATQIYLTGGINHVNVKETPEEIMYLIEYN